MSIKRLSPEAIETFSIVLHPKRRYSARMAPPATSTVPANAITTQAGDPITTQAGDYVTTQS